MEKVVITFLDGTHIRADKNGNCYITDEEPEFAEDLSEVTVSDGTVYVNARRIECASADGRYWFSFHEETPDERLATEVEKQRGDIDFIAMCCDVELEV